MRNRKISFNKCFLKTVKRCILSLWMYFVSCNNSPRKEGMSESISPTLICGNISWSSSLITMREFGEGQQVQFYEMNKSLKVRKSFLALEMWVLILYKVFDLKVPIMTPVIAKAALYCTLFSLLFILWLCWWYKISP